MGTMCHYKQMIRIDCLSTHAQCTVFYIAEVVAYPTVAVYYYSSPRVPCERMFSETLSWEDIVWSVVKQIIALH